MIGSASRRRSGKLIFGDRSEPIAQPDDLGMGTSSGAPDHYMRKRPNRKRNLSAVQPIRAQRLGERNRRQGGQQIRASQNRGDGGEMRYPTGDAALQPRCGRREIHRACQAVANPHGEMRPLRPAFASPSGKRRMSLTAEAPPFQFADRFAADAPGQSELRRHNGDVDLPVRHIQRCRLSRRGPLDGNAGRIGPQARQQLRKKGQREIGATNLKTRREDAGSKTCRGERTRSIPRSIGRTCSIRSSAKAVGCIRAPALINSGSPN